MLSEVKVAIRSKIRAACGEFDTIEERLQARRNVGWFGENHDLIAHNWCSMFSAAELSELIGGLKIDIDIDIEDAMDMSFENMSEELAERTLEMMKWQDCAGEFSSDVWDMRLDHGW